jgi:hypothetical protein
MPVVSYASLAASYKARVVVVAEWKGGGCYK